MSTKVKVIEPNVYAGSGWRALPKSAEGDIIEVATARYAADLVDSGLVEYVIEDESEPVAETPEPVPSEGTTDDSGSDPKGDGGSGSENGQENGGSDPSGDGQSGDAKDDETADGDGSEQEAPQLKNILDLWLVDKLVDAGLDTPAKVNAADDASLLNIKGVGDKTVADIRAKLAG